MIAQILANSVKNILIYNYRNVINLDQEIEYLYILEFKNHYLVLMTEQTKTIVRLLAKNLANSITSFCQECTDFDKLLRFTESFIHKQLKDINLFFE
jgi:hypothetical protein